MTDFERTMVVKSTEAGPLSAFLDGLVQPWRVPILLAGGGIQVRRAGQDVAPLKLESPLQAGDVVGVDDARSQCYAALRREASTNFCDYVFSKPKDSDEFHKNMLTVIARRPHTDILDETIDDLVKLVHRLIRAGKRPIRHIVIVSHASTFGNLEIAQSMAIKDITWDSLVAAVADQTLRIDMEERNKMGALLPRPEDSNGLRIPAAVIIRGCNVGLVTPFLDKLREALGPMIDVVVAPKFASAAAVLPSLEEPTYAFEYMQDDFFLYSDKRLKRAELIKKCQERKFKDWQGNIVNDKSWEAWIPDEAHLHTAKELMHTAKAIVATAKIEAIFPITLPQRHNLRVQYEYAIDENPLKLPLEPPLKTEDLKEAFRQYMGRKPRNDVFPQYRQWGYATLEDLINGFSYEFTKPQSGRPELNVTMTRHVYEIRVPITGAQGRLICNFYPKGGTPVVMIDENDDRFFGRSGAIPAHFAQKI